MRRCFVTLLLLAPGAAQAEINLVESLEWMTVRTPLVVRGKVIRCVDVQDPVENRPYRDVTIAVAEKLKGRHDEKTVTLRLLAGSDDPRGHNWKKSGHEYLFFLTRENRDGLKGLEGRWQPLLEPIDLDSLEHVYSARMYRLTRRNDALAIVRKYTRLPTPGGGDDPTKRSPSPLVIEVPTDADIFNELYGGSAVLMTVPADEEYRPRVLALARSPNGWERERGARQLLAYPGRESVQLLRELLKDGHEAQVFAGQGKLVRVEYPVRRAAYQSLLGLGEKPAKPVTEREPTPEEVRRAAGPNGNRP